MKTTESLKTTATAVKPVNYIDYTMYEGYQWAEVQASRGLWCNPAFGDWPYVIIANGHNDNYIIKEYAEHDVKTWIYADNEEGKQEYTHHLNQLKAYWANQEEA